MRPINDHERLPITANSLRNEALDKLRRWILTGRIQPGERIVETEVARLFGTSQAPVREALGRLEEDGLVCRVPYRGTRATEIIPKEIYHTFRLRAQIECNGLEVTVPAMTEEQTAQLAAIVDRMQDAMIRFKEDYFYQAQLDMEFHALLLEWAEVDVYRRAWHSLKFPIQRFLNLVHPSFFAHDRRAVIGQHWDLVSIFQTHDFVRAQEAMREHIMLIWDQLGPELLVYDRLDPKMVRSVDLNQNPV